MSTAVRSRVELISDNERLRASNRSLSADLVAEKAVMREVRKLLRLKSGECIHKVLLELLVRADA